MAWRAATAWNLRHRKTWILDVIVFQMGDKLRIIVLTSAFSNGLDLFVSFNP